MTITELIKQGTMYAFDMARLDDNGSPKVVIYVHRTPAVMEFIEAENYENYPAEYGLYLFLKQPDIAEFLDYHYACLRWNHIQKIIRLNCELQDFEQGIKLVKSKLEK